MPQPCNGLAPEERADILRVRPQGALCTVRFLLLGIVRPLHVPVYITKSPCAEQ
jgi:hypothetical protein